MRAMSSVNEPGAGASGVGRGGAPPPGRGSVPSGVVRAFGPSTPGASAASVGCSGGASGISTPPAVERSSGMTGVGGAYAIYDGVTLEGVVDTDTDGLLVSL